MTIIYRLLSEDLSPKGTHETVNTNINVGISTMYNVLNLCVRVEHDLE